MQGFAVIDLETSGGAYTNAVNPGDPAAAASPDSYCVKVRIPAVNLRETQSSI